MASRRVRGFAFLTALLALLFALASGSRWGLRSGWLPDHAALRFLAAQGGALLGATLTSLVLLVLFRSLSAGLRRRAGGEAPRAMRTLENTAAFAVAALVAVVAVRDVSTALVSLGLVGFALTLALQRPILSVAGWGAIRFGRLFREGDRIEIEGIVGDVLEVGLLKTRIWEIGSSASPLPWGGAVSPLRDTGRVVTLGNATFLERPLANASSGIPFVFDEFAVPVAFEGDWRLAERLLLDLASKAIDPGAHARAAREYERLTEELPTKAEFPREPRVLMVLRDSWIELRLRYLVDVRRRSFARTALARAWQEASEAHAERLPNVYPRVQPQAVGADGRPVSGAAPYAPRP